MCDVVCKIVFGVVCGVVINVTHTTVLCVIKCTVHVFDVFTQSLLRACFVFYSEYVLEDVLYLWYMILEKQLNWVKS